MTFATRVLAFEQKPQRPKAEGYNIKVGADWFRTIANRQVPIQIGSRDSLAPRQDQEGSIYQNVLDIGYAWGRTDLSGGEGLDWDPREIALDQNETGLDLIRFWDSAGLENERPDKQGEQYVLKLARTFEQSPIVVTDPADMTVSTDTIYIADGGTVTQYVAWDDATGVPTTGLPNASFPDDNIRAIAAAPNNTVMVTLIGGDIYVKPSLSTIFELAYDHTAPAKPLAQGIWYLQGRFMASTFDAPDSSEVIEMVWNATNGNWLDDPLIVDSADGEFWSIVESGPAIVSSCNDGTVRSYTPDSSGATPTMNLIPRSRTTMPEGETPVLLGSNAGVLLIMTTADHSAADREELRLYRAEVLDARFDFVVGQLQLKREWRSAQHEGLVTRNMTNTRDAIFFFVKEEAKVQVAEDESLWRFDVVTAGLTRIAVVSPEKIETVGYGFDDGLVSTIDAGQWSRDNADPSLVTELYIHEEDINNNLIVDWLAVKIGTEITFTSVFGDGVETYTADSTANLASSVYTIQVTPVSDTGTLFVDLEITDIEQESPVNLNGLAVFDQQVAGINFASPSISVSDNETHQVTGYMIFPNITFGLNTPITWIATLIEAHDLVGTGAQIELFYSDDPTAILDRNDSSWILAQRVSSQGATSVEIPFANLKSRSLALQLRINSSTSSSLSPKVTRIALRGIPAHRDLIMMVPFNISDYVSAPGRRPTKIPGLGYALHEQVLNLVGSSVEAVVIDPPMGFRGVVNNVSEPIEYLAERGSVTRYVMVEFRGQRLVQTVPPTGDSGMGLGLMGLDIIGIGQSEDT